MRDWMKDAVTIDNVEIDIGFNIWPSVYYGPSGGSSAKEYEHLHEPIYQPKITLIKGHSIKRALSRHVIDFESELIKYYRDLIRLSQKHEKRLYKGTPEFHLCPYFYKPIDFPVDFYLFDYFSDCEYLFKALLSEEEGEIFFDQDQSWEMHIYLHDGKLYFHQSDPDDATQPAMQIVVKKFDSSELLLRLKQTQQIINILIREFGFDRWSRSIYEKRD